jgi:PAS domain S-box-containing protein/diguanylate cyclase (GGDEF)-like protein
VTDNATVPAGNVRELLDSLRDAGIVVNAAGTIVLVNARATELLGYTPEELLGRPLEQLLPEGLRRSHAAQRAQFFTQPRPRPMGVGINLSALRKDGAVLPVEIGLQPVGDAADPLVIASLRTIDRGEQWYRSMFERLAVGVVHSDEAGRFLSVNNRFCKMLGYAREEAVRLELHRVIHPKDIARNIAERARAVEGAQLEYETDVRMIAKGGATVWTHVVTSIVRHGDGAPTHLISLIQDVSRQKLIEARLRESDRRFRQVTENIREVFWLTDLSKRALLYVSPGFLEIWGRSTDQLRATPQLWFEAIHPEDRPRVLEAVRTKQVAATFDEEYRIVRPDGTVRWIRDRAFPVRGAGETVTRIAGVAEDITDRKRSLDELQESERRFREILGKVHMISVTLDREARITFCNDFLLNLTGWQREEVLGRSWFDLFVPADALPAAARRFTAMLADSPTVSHYESEMLTRSGARRRIRWNNIVLRSPRGEPIGAARIGEDVTEQVCAEEVRARLAAIVESSDDAIIGKTLEGIITSWNAAARKLFGYDAEEAIGRSITLIVPPERLAEEATILERLRRGERISHFETVRRHKSGSLIDVSLTISPILDSQGRIIGASKIARDITERKRADLKIRHLNRMYAVLSSINWLIVRVRNRDELFREACRIAVDSGNFRLAWLGIVERSAMRLTLIAWHGMDADYVSRIPLGLADTAATGSGLAGRAVATGRPVISNDMARDERILLKSESAERGIRSTAYLPLLSGETVVGVLALYSGETDFFDAAELRLLLELAGDIAFALDHIEKANRVDYLAFYDPLTGLANRALFIERLGQQMLAAQAAHEEIFLVLADIERFRSVNDSLGRQAGDALLKLLGDRLALVAGNTRSARLTGDTFAMVLQGYNGRTGLELALGLMWDEIFGKPFNSSGADLNVAARAGIAVFPADAADAEALLSCAEAALRRAKETGETYVFHAPEMAARSAERRTLESRLRRALERQEFVLHYQPKLELQSRHIVGVEALLRWQSPDLGLVAPLRFIPLLEETGMILEVGAWVLARAVHDHHRWRERGIAPPRVAVNVSPIQLRRRDFVDTVSASLAGEAVSPGIDLEITESLLMESVEENIRKLRELRERGIAIAIDDFGTGYSSLSYLTRLPVQALKVDRSFILAMSEDPDTTTLVQTIISLAHSLNLRVIAEGVETIEQSKLLRLLRCDEIQGYLISRPLPFDEITTVLEGTATAPVTRVDPGARHEGS